MIKLFKHFTLLQWVLIVILFVLLVVQCYCDVTLPSYTAELITKMQLGHSTSSILSTGYIMLFYAGASIVLTLIITFISFYITSMHAKTLRAKIYAKVESFSLEELSRFSTSSLITRSTNDVQQVTWAIMMIMRIGIAAPLNAILALIKINSASYEFTVSMAIGIALMIAGIMIIMVMVVPKFKIIQKLIDRLNGVARENLTGIRAIRAFNAEQIQTEKFEDINKDFTKANIFTNRIMGLMQPLIMLINYGLTIAIYWLGCFLIMRDNNPSLFASMFSFTQLAGQVVMSFMMIVMVLLMVPRAQVSAKRISEVLNTKPIIIDTKNAQKLPNGGKIEFRNVSFAYYGATESVLKNISFTVQNGETVALIGATGCGKSTLINLIPRFFDATYGEVLINDVDVKKLKQDEIRSIIGYTPQTSVLFSGSIKDNIALSIENCNQSQIEVAAKVACADEFINTMQNTYDTIISQGGKNISGGQKQRISIARSVAANPQIYIFDDSFSALDFKTDSKVRQNLKKHASTSTKIIVAQRIGTIKDADKILVLNNGEIVGNGTHSQLLQNCDYYKSIALSQLSQKELEL